MASQIPTALYMLHLHAQKSGGQVGEQTGDQVAEPEQTGDQVSLPVQSGDSTELQSEDQVNLELATVNCPKREKRLSELLSQCPGPKHPAPGGWKLIVPSVKVQRGDPGSMDVPTPKVSHGEDKPPMLRAVATRRRDGAARTVQWLAQTTQKQGLFEVKCRTKLAEVLKKGPERVLGTNTEASSTNSLGQGSGDGQGSQKRGVPRNNAFLLEQERLAQAAKMPKIVGV